VKAIAIPMLLPGFILTRKEKMVESVAARIIDQLTTAGLHILKRQPTRGESKGRTRNNVGGILVHRLLRAILKTD
jgi:hypothetical protein